MLIEHGAKCAARRPERSFIVELDLHAVRQINGDLRIDDGDEGPMLEIKFHDSWSCLPNEDKDEILGVVVTKLSEILSGRYVDRRCDRRGAVAATKANNVG